MKDTWHTCILSGFIGIEAEHRPGISMNRKKDSKKIVGSSLSIDLYM